MQLQRTQSRHISSIPMHWKPRNFQTALKTKKLFYLTWLLLRITWAFQITCQDIPSSWAAQPNFFASTPKSRKSTSSPSAVPLILWLQVFLKSAVSNPAAPSEDDSTFLCNRQMLSPLLDLTQIQIAMQPLFILSKLTKPCLPWTAIFDFTLVWVSFLRGRRGSFYTAVHH